MTRQADRATAPLLSTQATTTYHKVDIDGVGIFYREAGPEDAPAIVLLHGFPSSSREFDTLIPSWPRATTSLRRTTRASG